VSLQQILNQTQNIKEWVKADWEANPWRLAAETWNWISCLIAATIFALTAPDVPFMITYPIWLSGTILNIFCAYSRNSFGTLMMAISMTIIDVYGFVRLILQ
jgi:hypothetical protein